MRLAIAKGCTPLLDSYLKQYFICIQCLEKSKLENITQNSEAVALEFTEETFPNLANIVLEIFLTGHCHDIGE